MLGGEEAFREFVDACHARGMKVVLDGVFNHTGRGHWAFTSLLDAQEQSPYRGWFLPKSFPVRAYDVVRGRDFLTHTHVLIHIRVHSFRSISRIPLVLHVEVFFFSFLRGGQTRACPAQPAW